MKESTGGKVQLDDLRALLLHLFQSLIDYGVYIGAGRREQAAEHAYALALQSVAAQEGCVT